MASGGYQRPSTPAPVSGPGALSQRTDSGPTQAPRYISGGNYGDGQALMGLQQSASLAGASASLPTPSVAAAPTGQQAPVPFGGTPLGAPTARPDEPITHGAPFGAGAGPEALTHATTVAPAPAPGVDKVAVALRDAYRLNPNALIGNLLTQLEQEGR